MCGIVGYAGDKQAAPIILDALSKLEYRGYDSAGIATLYKDAICFKKTNGRLSVLYNLIDGGKTMQGVVGVGHTRWATHGKPSDENSHPHVSQSGRVAVVHNGIVENYAELKAFLLDKGYVFSSDTDTEVATQLIDYNYHGDPVEAVRETVNMLVGSFALGIVFSDRPDTVIAVRKDSPLIIGVGENENFIASDVPAILKHTRTVIRLAEYELAVLTKDNVTVYDRYGQPVEKQTETITWDAESAEKGGFDHFMLKEINEQPEVIRKTVQPRIIKGKIELGLKHITDEDIRNADSFHIVACGSAYHVGMICKQYLEKYTRTHVYCQLASEFRYEDPIVSDKSITIVVSQSGETIDTLFALREAKARGSKTVSIVNVVGSTIANESDDVIYTWAGPEIAVATTKAYSAQLAVMYLLTLKVAECKKTMPQSEIDTCLASISALPPLIEKPLGDCDNIKYLASLFFASRDIFFIGRGLDYALALEGSLKLKEISYIHSEAYAAGELKHGTISLIEKDTLVIALCTQKQLAEKMVSNMREVKARGAVVIALALEGCTSAAEVADHVIYVPDAEDFVLPSLSIIPLQLFAYYIALLKGCDIDKPRNLAKSVTVE